jgi:hypothetical protein
MVGEHPGKLWCTTNRGSYDDYGAGAFKDGALFF